MVGRRIISDLDLSDQLAISGDIDGQTDPFAGHPEDLALAHVDVGVTIGADVALHQLVNLRRQSAGTDLDSRPGDTRIGNEHHIHGTAVLKRCRVVGSGVIVMPCYKRSVGIEINLSMSAVAKAKVFPDIGFIRGLANEISAIGGELDSQATHTFSVRFQGGRGE